ncbi:MAG: ATP-binding cassette domain-containing protein [Colwellia sp.]|nr:ATP-binding cassette domain-containing protein [Colwellia sp.]MCW8864493.1 ATP-binding cassette domain-containing protein [Colwellia sp.]MCW9081059.1 ATP-binding cassette domain-containing protein [Colwellia sp.]
MTSNSEIILKTQSIIKSVTLENKQLHLLQGVNLTVYKGETVAIVGSSGSGKTTLLSLLAGLDLPSQGEVYLKNKPLHQLNEEERSQVRAEHVGFIFQQFLLVNSLTALENVMLPAELANNANAKQEAQALLAEVGLSDRANHFPSQLSGGEQQRVAIARAFITKPDILFADEPTGNLDKQTSNHIADLLFDLNKLYDTTLVLVTHDLSLAKRCQRSVEMKSGQLVTQLASQESHTEQTENEVLNQPIDPTNIKSANA